MQVSADMATETEAAFMGHHVYGRGETGKRGPILVTYIYIYIYIACVVGIVSFHSRIQPLTLPGWKRECNRNGQQKILDSVVLIIVEVGLLEI